MAVDTADLEIRVRSLGAETAKKRLDNLATSSGRAEKATDGLTGAFKKLVAPLLAVVGAGQILNQIIDAQRGFDKLQSTLTTLTGSTEKANEVFKVLQNYANVTPFSIQNLNDSFIKLVNYGLDPSERAMTSYGNTAVSLGKDITDMVAAVSSATTGEFDALKSFGIKTQNLGATVKFSFQGVTTTVKNSSEEIEKYLMALGENQFAGAMEKNLGKLDDTMAGLGEQYDTLMLNISQAGVGEVIQESVQLGVDALTELNTMLASGEMEAYLIGYSKAWAVWGSDVIETVKILDSYLESVWPKWKEDAADAGRGMYLGFNEFPSEIRAYFQEAGVEVANFVIRAQNYAKYFQEAWDNILSDPMGRQAEESFNQRDRDAKELYESSMAQIANEKTANQQSLKEQLEAGAKIREEYDKQMEAKAKLAEDRLAQYKITGTPDTGLTPAEKTKAEAKAKQLKKEYDDLVASLNTELEAINASYEKRKKIIEKNTEDESATRKDLMARLNKDRQEELDKLNGVEKALDKRKRLAGEVQDIEESMWDANTRAAAAYQKQIETLWQAQMAGVLNDQQHTEAVNQVTLAYEKQQDAASKSFLDMDEMGKQAARNIQDAFADFLFDPFSKGVDGMLLGFVKVVQRMAAEAAAAQLASKLFGSSAGGTGGGWLGSLVSAGSSLWSAWSGGGGALASAATSGASAGASGFASGFDASSASVNFPGRASGGPTHANQMYEVSERGPELYNRNGKTFLLDGQAGTVTPTSGESSSGSSPQVNIDITVVVQPDGSTNETNDSNDSSDAQELSERMKSVSLRTVQDEMRPGGLIWNMMENRNG